jgi:DNA-binding HxlR family transcriptional regulator
MGPPSDCELQPVAIYQTGFILQPVMIENRSGCPINLALEALGDRWSLIVIRDIMFGNSRRFRELLTRSQEGIASNILAARLKRLVETGVLSRSSDPAHRQKGIYSLTEKGIELAPVLVQLGAWGRRRLPASPELAIRQQLMEEGGPALLSAFADEPPHPPRDASARGPRERHRSSQGCLRGGRGRAGFPAGSLIPACIKAPLPRYPVRRAVPAGISMSHSLSRGPIDRRRKHPDQRSRDPELRGRRFAPAASDGPLGLFRPGDFRPRARLQRRGRLREIALRGARRA